MNFHLVKYVQVLVWSGWNAQATRYSNKPFLHQKFASSTIQPIFSERMCLCVLFSLFIIFMLTVHTLAGVRYRPGPSFIQWSSLVYWWKNVMLQCWRWHCSVGGWKGVHHSNAYRIHLWTTSNSATPATSQSKVIPGRELCSLSFFVFVRGCLCSETVMIVQRKAIVSN